MRARRRRTPALGTRALWPIACLLALAACSLGPRRTPTPTPAPAAPAAAAASSAAPPAGPEAVPDAVPRFEPRSAHGNPPFYDVLGHRYFVLAAADGYSERGVASWYGPTFHGGSTSSGEPYDMYGMTAAHKTLPIPCYAQVTNLRNGRRVVVRINDRGPFHSKRIIDLSYAAAKKIGILARGSGTVEVERVFESTPGAPAQPPTPISPEPAEVTTPIVAKEASGIWLQLGAFGSPESAAQFRDRVQRDLSLPQPLQVVTREGLSRVRMGPYRTLDEAAIAGDKVRQSLGYSPTLIEN